MSAIDASSISPPSSLYTVHVHRPLPAAIKIDRDGSKVDQKTNSPSTRIPMPASPPLRPANSATGAFIPLTPGSRSRQLSMVSPATLPRDPTPDMRAVEFIKVCRAIDHFRSTVDSLNAANDGDRAQLMDSQFASPEKMVVDLSNCHIRSLPDQLQRLSITKLILSNNELGKYPRWLGDQKLTLHTVKMSKCKLQAIPSFVFELSSLTILDVSHNNITQVVPLINSLQKLIELDLSYNFISSLDDSFCQLKLTRLSLQNQNHCFAGEIPLVIFSIPTLMVLNLSHNQFTKVPEVAPQQIRLESLDLSNNQLGSISPVFKWSSLKELRANKNVLIDLDGFYSLVNLELFYCVDNLLSSFPHGKKPSRLRALLCETNESSPEWVKKLAYETSLGVSSNRIGEDSPIPQNRLGLSVNIPPLPNLNSGSLVGGVTTSVLINRSGTPSPAPSPESPSHKTTKVTYVGKPRKRQTPPQSPRRNSSAFMTVAVIVGLVVAGVFFALNAKSFKK